MELYLVRHGQSENNLLWDRTGASKGRSDDPALTLVGVSQAEAVAHFLANAQASRGDSASDLQNRNGFGISHVYCSLMIRAIGTGAAIARATNLPLVAWEELHEGGGIYLDDEVSGEPVGMPGKDRAYFAAHYPELELPDGLYTSGWWCRPFERPEHRRERAQRVLCELRRRHGDTQDRVAAVTHGEFYNYLLAGLFDLPSPAEGRFWFALNNVGVTRIDFRDSVVVPVYMNRVDFLPADLVT